MKHLTRDQLRDVLSAAKASRERDWLMILTAFWHGLRASEVTSLTAAAIADGFLTVRRLKGSDTTTQPLIASADELLDERSALASYTAGMLNEQRLFPVSRIHFYRLFKRYSAAAGIPQHLQHPHVLKHSIAMQTIDGAGVQNVKKYLGHKSLASTGAYLEVDDDTASKAIAAAAGR